MVFAVLAPNESVQHCLQRFRENINSRLNYLGQLGGGLQKETPSPPALVRPGGSSGIQCIRCWPLLKCHYLPCQLPDVSCRRDRSFSAGHIPQHCLYFAGEVTSYDIGAQGHAPPSRNSTVALLGAQAMHHMHLSAGAFGMRSSTCARMLVRRMRCYSHRNGACREGLHCA
jgi:hypothetical protein